MMISLWLLRLSLVLLVVKAQLVSHPTTNANERGNNFVMNLLHVNDHHSHLEEDTLNVPVEGGKTRKILIGGYPRIIKFMRMAKNKWANVLKIHAGDAIVGTGYYHLFGTDPDMEMMHRVCYDVFNLGNHEFDDGDGVLANFIKRLTDHNSPCQNTRVLSANILPGENSPLKPLKERGYIAPYVIRNFNGGHKVGIIGINTRNKTMTGSQPDEGTLLTDERVAIRQQIRTLEKAGVNKIVLVSHLGYARDLKWLQNLEGVDVIIGAHSHTLLAKQVDFLKPRSQYPKIAIQQTTGKPICVAHAWRFGHGVGRLRVEFDENGDVVMCGGNFVIPFEANPKDAPEDAAATTKYLDGLPSFVHTIQNQEALSALQKYTVQMDGQQYTFDSVLVKEAEPLCNEDVPGGGQSEACTKEETRSHGGAACQLVAQAILDQVPEADVAIQNAGGCRADVVAGNFTYGQAMEFLPYSDNLVTLNVTGFQIHRVMEQALELALGDGESTGSYPYASGLRFDVNASEGIGQRISNLQLNSRLAEGVWNDINWDANYTIATNSFVAAGRDGYFEFANIASQQDMGVTYLDAFISYVEEQGGIATPDPENMSTQHFVGEVASTDDMDGGEEASPEESEFADEGENHNEDSNSSDTNQTSIDATLLPQENGEDEDSSEDWDSDLSLARNNDSQQQSNTNGKTQSHGSLRSSSPSAHNQWFAVIVATFILVGQL